MLYVTMTDKFMSGWGMASGKINKLVFECDSWEQAETVAENAGNRSEMKYINIRRTAPYYNHKKYYVQYKNISCSPAWYEKGRF